MSFNRKDTLKRHLIICKDVIKETTCNKCGRSFQTNWHLNRHLVTCKSECLGCKKKLNDGMNSHNCELQIKLPISKKKHAVKPSTKKEVQHPQKSNDLIDMLLEWDTFPDHYDDLVDLVIYLEWESYFPSESGYNIDMEIKRNIPQYEVSAFSLIFAFLYIFY